MNFKVGMLVVGCVVVIILASYFLFLKPTATVPDRVTEAATSSQATSMATTTQIIMNAINATEPNEGAVLARFYAPLTPFTLGGIPLQASIADTESERAQGLSNTPYIPAGIAKVFIFESAQKWSFWMKDMQYPIDIFWIDESGAVVHVVEFASPNSYPETSFAPPVPALYVIETKAGFAQEHAIGVGAVVEMAEMLLPRS